MYDGREEIMLAEYSRLTEPLNAAPEAQVELSSLTTLLYISFRRFNGRDTRLDVHI